MNAAKHTTAPKGLSARWKSPPRSGMQLLIAPWEYRHLRGFARLRTASGAVLVALGILTLSFGGHDSKTYAWTLAFLAAALANFAFAYWELSIARSLPGQN